MSAVFALIPLVVGITLATWILSVFTREYSWVDRIWSVAPPVYAWILASSTGFADARVTLVATLITLWGARLTFNFWRRGGYAPGGEDYRWAVLREKLGPIAFEGFNATFISPYQNLLIFLLVVPMGRMIDEGSALGVGDAVLAALFVGLLGIETVADQQQFDFQTAKRAARARGEPTPDFRTDGLFRYSRHPNYFAELGQWWVVYAFAVNAGAPWVHGTIVGALLLTLLFDGSTRFTEYLTLQKYPAYADYQRTTSRILLRPPRRA